MLLQIEGLSPEQCAILARARTYKQYVRAVGDAIAGKCVFCQIDRDYNQVLIENEHWLVWPCRPPEKHTRMHFLIVSRHHVTSMNELDDATEGLALIRTLRQVREMHHITSSGLLCRDGDATLSAGTIPHLHFHVMVPDGTGRVETPFYKGAESEVEGHLRAIVYEKLRLGAKVEDLDPEERQRVVDRL